MEIGVVTVEAGTAKGGSGGMGAMEGGGKKTMAKLIASAEDFNARYGSLVGWQEAVRRIKPIPRAAAQFDLAAMLAAAGAKTTGDAIEHLLVRLLPVPVDDEVHAALVDFLDRQLGTKELAQASTYLERPL